jgi:hypothetical protein
MPAPGGQAFDLSLQEAWRPVRKTTPGAFLAAKPARAASLRCLLRAMP